MANNMTEDDRYAHITERRENKYNLFTELALQESKFGTAAAGTNNADNEQVLDKLLDHMSEMPNELPGPDLEGDLEFDTKISKLVKAKRDAENTSTDVLGRADALQDKVDSLRKQVDDQSDVNGELALQVSDLKDKLNQSSLRHFKYKSQHQDYSARIGKLEQQVSEKELQRLHADGSRQSYEKLAASRLASLGQLRSEMRGLQDQVSKLNEQCFTAKGKFFKAEKAKAEAERKLHKQGGMLEIEQQRASSQRNRIEELNSQVRMLTDQVAASRHETDQLKLNHTAELNNLIAGHVLDVSELVESEAQLYRIAHADQFDELDRENSEFRNQLEDEIQFLHVEKEEVDLLAHKQSELLDKLLDDKEALIKERDELILLCQESTAAVDERRESFEL